MTEPHQGQYDGGNRDLQDPPAQQGQRSGSEAVAGPFTLREAVIGGSVLLIFVGTVLPFVDGMGRYGNLWNTFPLFFLGIGIVLPVAAFGLITARRLGSANLHVGSLSVDQFASVVAALATAFFFLQSVTAFHYGPFIALLGAVGMLASTVGGPQLPFFRSDFTGRPESSAHLVTRGVLPARRKEPKAPKPVPAEQVSQWNDHQSADDGRQDDGGRGTGGGVAAGAGLGSGLSEGVGAGTGARGAGGLEHLQADGIERPAPGEAPRSSRAPTSADDPKQDTPTAHIDSAVSAVPGVQDKELPDADSSRYPRSADEDFAPYADRPEPEAERGGRQEPEAHTGSGTAGAPAAANAAGGTAPDRETGRQEAVGAGAGSAGAAATAAHPVIDNRNDGGGDSISATRDSDDEGPMVEAFWFAVGTPRPVVDEESGVEIFVLRPGDWEVGIEDRGEEFLVQDKRTGRVGVMRDLSNIERAPGED